MLMKPRVILSILLLVGVAGASLYFYACFLERPRPEKNTLTVSGNIEAHESDVSFQVQGRIVELSVEEGQFVERGAALARLDAADYRQQVAHDEAALKVREAELALALAGTRPQEIAAAEQTVLDAEADLRQKKLDFERNQTLYSNGMIAAQERDIAETALKRAQAIYERAKKNYDEAMEGTRKEQIAINRANVVQAREALGISRINLDHTVLRAPKAGVILVRQAELGEVNAPGTPVVTLADLDNIWLRAYINETDLGRVRWGQPVAVRSDTYPGKSYRGRISFISSSAEFTPKSVETHAERVTLVYRVKIDVENPNHELKFGMPADAVIQLDQR
jgi:HlyD family secretion protein